MGLLLLEPSSWLLLVAGAFVGKENSAVGIGTTLLLLLLLVWLLLVGDASSVRSSNVGTTVPVV